MHEQDLIELWEHEEQQSFSGWNFSHLKGRYFEPAPPWSYEEIVQELLRDADSALDMGTGGGEKLLEFKDLLPASDLVEGKNSLPVLAGLSAGGKFAAWWKQGPIKPEEVEEVARLLTNEGGYATAYEAAKQMTDLALLSLREADPQGEAGEALFELTDRLLKRNQ